MNNIKNEHIFIQRTNKSKRLLYIKTTQNQKNFTKEERELKEIVNKIIFNMKYDK